MEKKRYISPEIEIVSAKLHGDLLDDGFPIPVSGETTPEESDAKDNNLWDWEEENNENGLSEYNLWDY